MRIAVLLSLATMFASTFAIRINDFNYWSDFKSHPLFFRSSIPKSDEEKPAEPCTPQKCKPPMCRCSGTDIPGGLSMADTPQMISLTFQNGIRKQELAKYQSLFSATRNPNGCPGTGTFFVSHENTDYFTVQTLRSERHEIGVNGVNATHTQQWWKDASVKDWVDEMQGEREILGTLAGISSYEIIGERAPYLQMGGNNQLSAMQRSNILYDASRVSVQFVNPPNLLWPYTYDYASTQDCVVPNCPTESFKGKWQMPLLALIDQSGNPCATLDACNATTSTEVFVLLYRAFIKHYLSNRAPLILTLSARWVQDDQKMEGTINFLTFLRSFQDVYLVSINRVGAWVTDPTKLSDLTSFEPFKCDQTPPPVCSESAAVTCRYNSARQFVNQETADVIYRTTTCRKCPPCYPWVGDTQGRKCKGL